MKIAKWKWIVSGLLILAPGFLSICRGGSAGVLIPCVSLLAGHVFCLLVTAKDPGNAEQSGKVMDLLLWIVPVLSWVCMGFFAAAMAENTLRPDTAAALLLGLLALVFGNYLPKTRRNSTIGIKIKWTLENDANWNATHRFGGRVWVLCGAGFLASAFLPQAVNTVVFALLVAVMVLLPTLFSYRYYRRQAAAGEYEKSPATIRALSGKWGAAIVAAITVLVVLLMFTGSVSSRVEDDRLVVRCTYWQTESIALSDITDVEYLPEFQGGQRVMGIGSARLRAGTFRSEALGSYTRCTDNRCKDALLVRAQGRIYVINASTDAETRALYEALRP